MIIRKILLAIIFAGISCNALAHQDLKSGWFPNEPFQYKENYKGIDIFTGFDIKFAHELAKKLHNDLSFSKISWNNQLKMIQSGQLDFVLGASKTEQRTSYAIFSEPYRTEELSLFVRSGNTKTPAEVITNKYIIANVESAEYGDIKIINELKGQNLLISVSSYEDAIEKLLEGSVDGFIATKTVGDSLIWRTQSFNKVSEIKLNIILPVHIMISKKSPLAHDIDKVNSAIQSLKNSGEIAKIQKDYLLPTLLKQILDQNWFFILDILGTIAFAISGLILAYKQKKSWFGSLFLAALPAIGGGVIRDLLVDRRPIGILSSPVYLITIFLTVAVGVALMRLIPKFAENKRFLNWLNHIFQASDAIGLAAFTIIGAVVAVMTKAEPLWLWAPLLAVITGAGGGIIRDLFRYDRFVSAIMGEIYAEVAAFWGFVFAGFIYWQQNRANFDEMQIGVIIIFFAALITRLIVYAKDMRSPLFNPKNL